jgi:glycosyltransferase involved in cell wall biosynthesis
MADTAKGIKYISLHGALGFFVAAKRYMLGLRRLGIPFTWTPMVPGNSWGMGLQPFTGKAIGDPELDPYCNRPLEYDTVIIHTPPDLYPRWAAVEKGRRLFGYTAWETDRIPSFWPACFDGIDHLLVPSRWNRDTLVRCGITTPVTVVPHIVPAAAESAPQWRDGGRPYIFYAIETWTARKNLDLAIRCYLETFHKKDPVLLVIKTFPQIYRHTRLTRHGVLKNLYVRLRRGLRIPPMATIRPDAGGQLRRIVDRYPDGGRIELITAELNENEITALHIRGDCYLSLTHGEGWGIGSFDAAAFGNPVIMTGWGGQLDYLDPDHAHLVGCDLVPARDDDNRHCFAPGQLWAEPRRADAVALMRRVFENPAAARALAETLQKRIHAEYSSEKITARLLAALAGS